MLSEREKEALRGLFIKNGRILDFRAESFSRFVESVLWKGLPREGSGDGSGIRGGYTEQLGAIISGNEIPYWDKICLLRALLAHYEALVAEDGLVAARVRDDWNYALCRLVINRESQAVLGTKPPLEEVLPRLEEPPTDSLSPADYYFRLWRRTLELYPVWNDIDLASLRPLDHLCHGFDAELLKLARAFGALEVFEDALARKSAEDKGTRVSHLLIRSAAARKAIDAMVMEEVFLRQDESPQWLVSAVGRFNRTFTTILNRYACGISVASYIPLLDAFTECAESWEERGVCLGRRRRLHHGDDWSFRFTVSKFIRYADVFAHDLNARECAGRGAFLPGELQSAGREAFGTLLRRRHEVEEDARERAVANYCSHLARRVRRNVKVASNLVRAAEYILLARPEDEMYALCRKATDYKAEYDWSDAEFIRFCRQTPKRDASGLYFGREWKEEK